jgi:predicted nucleic acid-binding protein
MSGPAPYLLDTNVVLIATRSGNVAAGVIDQRLSLRASSFRPSICEVTVAELLAFAHAWGDVRRRQPEYVLADLLVLPITPRIVHDEWAHLRTHAKNHGMAVQHDHNDLWIAAVANVAKLTVITGDVAGFRPLKAAGLVSAEIVDLKTGLEAT